MGLDVSTDKDVDINGRLEQVEKKLEVIASNPYPVLGDQKSSTNDEIDLRELFGVIWQGKWLIVGVTFLFAVAGVVYSLSLPNVYKSEGVYAPAQKQSGVGGIGGQLGGLASLAGVSLGGGESNDIDQAMALITSWPFLEKVINKHHLKPVIMGAKEWSRDTRELTWDKKIYDPVNKKWLREPPKGQKAEPSGFEVYKKFSKSIDVKKNKKTELITISFSHVSPEVAKLIVDGVVMELNEHFRLRDMTSARLNIEYLKKKIEQTSLAEMQGIFYEMVQGQIKSLMLSEVAEDYLIRPVVSPVVAEERSAPSRVLILLLFMVSGGVVAIMMVFVLHIWRKND